MGKLEYFPNYNEMSILSFEMIQIKKNCKAKINLNDILKYIVLG